jgi:hypothetical protein
VPEKVEKIELIETSREENVSVPETPVVEEYVPRQVKLPESGTLDLGSKFVSRPAFVFHNRPAPSSDRPAQRSNPSPSNGIGGRPNFVSRPAQNGQGGFGQRRPAPNGSNGGRPGAPSSQNKGNFRKPDAPKKNFKTTKRGTKHKL